MSYRSAIGRLVAQTAKQQKKLKRNYFQPGEDRTVLNCNILRPSLPHLSRIFHEEKQNYSGWRSCGSDQWEGSMGDRVTEQMRTSFAEVGRCSSNGSSDESQPRRIFAPEIHVVENPRPAMNEISAAHIAVIGRSRRTFDYSYGRFGAFQGVGRSGYENVRFYSSAAPVVGENLPMGGAEQVDALAGVADSASTLAAASSGTSAISEVAAVVGDCSYPTAAIQYVIEGVHLSTGLPWWLSIAATTVAIRILVLPILVYQMKATARLTLMRPELEKLTNHIKENNYDPKVVEENQARMKLLFQEHKTSPLSPILGAFVQAPIFMCFFFAIRNMAERVESFKEGGALWFTDLSTPDSLFIMPVLSGAMFLLTVELGATDGMQGQPMLGKMKMFLRGLAILLVPLTANFPKALFCYWLTANVCSIVQAAVFKQPGVKGALGIPDVSHMAKHHGPIAPVMTFSQPPRLQSKTSSSQAGEKIATYVSKKRRA
ncbi:hypothetical protein R1flu_014208 [Riccia fluitans]|uniref:Membrane insertase YidC/Oxa/ALB C-terminal domain-containing protein n=1 Tax=Riccia fluitans TaxID=41844 RepID=A0ABD1YFK4_9MARC